MASFANMSMTQVGSQLIADLILSGEKIQFSGIAVGDGTLSAGQTPATMTALVHEVKRLSIQAFDAKQNLVKLTAVLSTADLSEDLLHRELGIYATHNSADVLIAYANAGEAYDYLPSPETSAAITKVIEASLLISPIGSAWTSLPSDDFLTVAGFEDRISQLLPPLVETTVENYAERIGLPTAAEEAKQSAEEAKASADTANQAVTDIATTMLQAAPPGSIAYHAASTPPAGWLECNGASLSRTTYAALFNAIGTTYGSDDDATFRIPDLRGYYVSAWDNGAGRDSDRIFGSFQSDAIRNLYGTITLSDAYNLGASPFIAVNGVFSSSYPGTPGSILKLEGLPKVTNSAYTSATSIVYNASSAGVPIGPKNRPENIALLPIIKY